MLQAGIFDEGTRQDRLTELGDPPEKMKEVDGEQFIPVIISEGCQKLLESQ